MSYFIREKKWTNGNVEIVANPKLAKENLVSVYVDGQLYCKVYPCFISEVVAWIDMRPSLDRISKELKELGFEEEA